MCEIEDIYEGELIQVWKDDEFIFFSVFTNGITLTLTQEDYKNLKLELECFLRFTRNKE